MMTGTVKWFSDTKGYGFIQPDDQGIDIFAHFSAINMEGFKTLRPGMRVSYELHDGPKGLHALMITLLPAGAQAITPIATQSATAPLLVATPAVSAAAVIHTPR